MVGIISLRFREFLWTWCRFKQINITLPKALPKQTKTYPKKICFFLKKKLGTLFFEAYLLNDHLTKETKLPRHRRAKDAKDWRSRSSRVNWLVVFARTHAVGFGVSPWRWCMFFSGGGTLFFGGGLVKAGYKKRPHLGSMDLSESCKLHRCFSEPLHRCFFVLAQP